MLALGGVKGGTLSWYHTVNLGPDILSFAPQLTPTEF